MGVRKGNRLGGSERGRGKSGTGGGNSVKGRVEGAGQLVLMPSTGSKVGRQLQALQRHLAPVVFDRQSNTRRGKLCVGGRLQDRLLIGRRYGRH